MNVSGIRPQTGAAIYESPRANELKALSKEIDQQADRVEENLKSREPQKNDNKYSAYDVAQRYLTDEAAAQATPDRQLENHRIKPSGEMQRAISDMKRDEVLQQYQFFVGTENGRITDPSLAFDNTDNFDI